MAAAGYSLCLLASVLVILHMAHKNYDNIDIYYWSILVINPIIILAYLLKTLVSTEEAARLAFCFSNIDGTVLLMLGVFTLLHNLRIKFSPWLKRIGYVAAFVHLAIICHFFNTDLYYKSVDIIKTEHGYATVATSGPFKIIHYVFLLLIIISVLIIYIIGIFNNGKYSKRTLLIYAIAVFVGLVLYIIESFTHIKFSLLPYFYAAISVLIGWDYDHIHMHDLSGLISTHYDSTYERGYVAIGLNKTLLGYNLKSTLFLPFLLNHRIDRSIKKNKSEEAKIILDLIDGFEAGKSNSTEIRVGDIICICEISYFSVRKDGKEQGYLLDIRDATEEKKNLEILEGYNDTLNREVIEKTKHIRAIQRKIVLGLANMIENRDNNTGGHVKRTSDIISIIVDEIKRQGNIELDDKQAANIIRSAPMHDLGKLHIDSNILCKPGRLTDDEYEIMKTHSTKSGEMVMILLEGIEEDDFVDTSFNLARYHHERWDGKGYPEGLVGSMIPIEARIMAVADVYDALVSKRCYKEPMSFEKAREIMCEGMGTQFDPNMKQIFLGCIEKLEDYYRTNPGE